MMKRSLINAGYPAIAASAFALLLGASSPSMGQNYDMPGYIPSKGTATGGPAGGPDQRQFVPGGATGGRSGRPDQRKAKVGHKRAKKASKPQ